MVDSAWISATTTRWGGPWWCTCPSTNTCVTSTRSLWSRSTSASQTWTHEQTNRSSWSSTTRCSCCPRSLSSSPSKGMRWVTVRFQMVCAWSVVALVICSRLTLCICFLSWEERWGDGVDRVYVYLWKGHREGRGWGGVGGGDKTVCVCVCVCVRERERTAV